MAVVVMLCSIDDEKGPQLYRIDPTGTVLGYRGASAGVKEQEALSLLEKRLKDPNEELNEDQTVQAAIHILQVCLSSDFKASDIEVGLVSIENEKLGLFEVLDDATVERHLNAIAERD